MSTAGTPTQATSLTDHIQQQDTTNSTASYPNSLERRHDVHRPHVLPVKVHHRQTAGLFGLGDGLRRAMMIIERSCGPLRRIVAFCHVACCSIIAGTHPGATRRGQ